MSITVIDSIMGSGKTNYMINYMNESYDKYVGESFTNPEAEPPRFIFVTPYLDETDRVVRACPDLRFRKPKEIESKSEHFRMLVDNGQNIATTHALFELVDRETLERIRQRGYVVIVDEVMECVRTYEKLSAADRRMLFSRGLIRADEGTERLKWVGDGNVSYKGRFVDVKLLCENDNLFLNRGDTILWTIPPHFFRSLDRVYVLTYMFHGSFMSAYLRSEGISYDMMAVVGGQLMSWFEFSDEVHDKEKYRPLIKLHKGSANAIGSPKRREQPLSSTWYSRQTSDELRAIRAKVQNWFKKYAKTGAKLNAWTTYKDYEDKIRGEGYAKGFITCNAKATNDYREKQSLAYLCNMFPNPLIAGYFKDKGVTLHEDLFALSEMLQWVWRSRIRDWESINLLIPSARMRALFEEWLGSASIAEMIQRREVARAPRLASEALHDDQLVVIPSAPEMAPEVILEDLPSQAADEPDSYIPSESSSHGRWVSPTALLQDLMRSFKPADANAASLEVSNS